MGRDYSQELLALEATRAWAASIDLRPWDQATRRASSSPAVVVASGGSLAAAHLLADLYQRRYGQVATVMTPLEFLALERLEADVWFLSAGGGNADVLAAWAVCVCRRPPHMFVLCAQPTSPLASAARAHPSATLIDFELPTGKDGFLATNSLLAFLVIIARLFGDDSASQPPQPFPTDFGARLPERTLLVLYDPALKPVAVDIESRFSEAALGHVLACDLRNFAHGRHVWLAKRGSTSTVLALSSPTWSELARATLALLPAEVDRHHWTFLSTNANGVLDGISASMRLAELAGNAARINPGRPGVPTFGSSIYNLGPRGYVSSRTWRQASIEGKAGKSMQRLEREGALARYEAALDHFIQELLDLPVTALVTDYDGTLVHTRDRFGPVSREVASQLTRLLDEGLVLGVATGRGKSVRKELTACIPKRFHDQVIVGYYNAGAVRSLAEPCEGIADGPLAPELERVLATLLKDPVLKDWERDPRPSQITVVAGQADLRERELWLRIAETVASGAHHDVKVVHSSHSVDILPVGVTKARVAEMLRARTHGACIQMGDRGRWPGNDAELLSLPNSLSVDEVSPHLSTCWNLVPDGLGGADAAAWYLKCLQGGRMRLDLP